MQCESSHFSSISKINKNVCLNYIIHYHYPPNKCDTWCCLQLLTNYTLSRVNVDAAMCKTAAKCSAVSCTLILTCATLIKIMTVPKYVARQN